MQVFNVTLFVPLGDSGENTEDMIMAIILEMRTMMGCNVVFDYPVISDEIAHRYRCMRQRL